MIKQRLRRTMIFLNAQRAALVQDAFVFQPDCVIFDLEDAVAESEKDSARIQLYNTLREVDYGNVERWVRINALDTDLFPEDIRAAVAGGAEGIRLPKTETVEDVELVEGLIEKANVQIKLNKDKLKDKIYACWVLFDEITKYKERFSIYNAK